MYWNIRSCTHFCSCFDFWRLIAWVMFTVQLVHGALLYLYYSIKIGALKNRYSNFSWLRFAFNQQKGQYAPERFDFVHFQDFLAVGSSMHACLCIIMNDSESICIISLIDITLKSSLQVHHLYLYRHAGPHIVNIACLSSRLCITFKSSLHIDDR